MWSKYLENFYNSDVSINNGNMKYPIGKSIFAVKNGWNSSVLPLLCWHSNSKVSKYIPWNISLPRPVEVWITSHGPNYTKFWTFWPRFWSPKKPQTQTHTPAHTHPPPSPTYTHTRICYIPYMETFSVETLQTTPLSMSAFQNKIKRVYLLMRRNVACITRTWCNILPRYSQNSNNWIRYSLSNSLIFQSLECECSFSMTYTAIWSHGVYVY